MAACPHDDSAYASSPFDGWEQYPSNLPCFDTLCSDSGGYSDRLKALSTSLFSEKIALHVIDANGECIRFVFITGPEWVASDSYDQY